MPGHVYLRLGAAASGGLANFLFAFKRGIVRNDKHCRQAMLEVVGGCVVGFFLSWPAPFREEAQLFIAFGGGVGWAGAVHVLRKKVTDLVEAAFGPIWHGKDGKAEDSTNDSLAT